MPNFLELRHDEVLRIPLPRTRVNKGKKKGRYRGPGPTIGTRPLPWRGVSTKD